MKKWSMKCVTLFFKKVYMEVIPMLICLEQNRGNSYTD